MQAAGFSGLSTNSAAEQRCNCTRTLRCVRTQAQKGFGGDEGSKPVSKKAKVSKRGKVASRPSQETQLAQLQAEEAAFQAALEAKAGEAGRPTPSPAPTARPSTRSGDGGDYEQQDAGVPEQITDRMLRRMVVFAGVPVFLGILLLPGFYYLKKVQGLEVPVWAVYIVQTLAFGGGLAGISYGILSASWDQRREGSVLGWDEFRANLPIVMDRFKQK